MFRVKTKNSDAALKNAWRFIALVYLLVFCFFLAGPTARHWMPTEWGMGGAILLVAIMLLSLIVAFCFALAALGWAIWSLRGRSPTRRQQSFFAIDTALVTVLLLGVYLLIETGIVRLR
jgi:hypothetical protein